MADIISTEGSLRNFTEGDFSAFFGGATGPTGASGATGATGATGASGPTGP